MVLSERKQRQMFKMIRDNESVRKTAKKLRVAPSTIIEYKAIFKFLVYGIPLPRRLQRTFYSSRIQAFTSFSSAFPQNLQLCWNSIMLELESFLVPPSVGESVPLLQASFKNSPLLLNTYLYTPHSSTPDTGTGVGTGAPSNCAKFFRLPTPTVSKSPPK